MGGGDSKSLMRMRYLRNVGGVLPGYAVLAESIYLALAKGGFERAKILRFRHLRLRWGLFPLAYFLKTA